MVSTLLHLEVFAHEEAPVPGEYFEGKSSILASRIDLRAKLFSVTEDGARNHDDTVEFQNVSFRTP